MAIAMHIVFGCYGFWLPNDPRGSFSRYVGGRDLYRLAGPASTLHDRRSHAHDPNPRREPYEASVRLSCPPVILGPASRLAVAEGLSVAVREGGYGCLAAAVLPNHVHLVVLWHDQDATRVVAHLKSRATRSLHAATDLDLPHVWARGFWKVFIDTREQLAAAIRYVEQNPIKAGLPPQLWPFVNRRSHTPGG